MGKNGYRTVFLVGLLCWACGFSCLASDIGIGGDNIGIEGYEGREEYGVEIGTTGENVGDISTLDSGTVSEEPPVREEVLTFAPASQIVEGSATMTDVYNVLASIHNMIIIGIFIQLIMWAYKIITETYRRFLKNV